MAIAMEFLLGTHQFLGNHTFAEFLIVYIFGGALIIGAQHPGDLAARYDATTLTYDSTQQTYDVTV